MEDVDGDIPDVPYAEHERIVQDLQSKIDLWVERYTELTERHGVLRDRLPEIISTAQSMVYIMRENMVRLEERVQKMREAMNARYTNIPPESPVKGPTR